MRKVRKKRVLARGGGEGRDGGRRKEGRRGGRGGKGRGG